MIFWWQSLLLFVWLHDIILISLYLGLWLLSTLLLDMALLILWMRYRVSTIQRLQKLNFRLFLDLLQISSLLGIFLYQLTLQLVFVLGVVSLPLNDSRSKFAMVVVLLDWLAYFRGLYGSILTLKFLYYPEGSSEMVLLHDDMLIFPVQILNGQSGVTCVKFLNSF